MKNKLLALFLIIGMIIFLEACGEDAKDTVNNEDSKKPVASSQQSGAVQTASTVYEIGKTGSAQFGSDKFEITVTGVAKEFISEDLKPNATHKYYYVPIQVKNASAQDSIFSAKVSLQVMYADNELMAVMGEADDSAQGIKGLFSSEIKAGETIEGNILLYVKESKKEDMVLCYKAKTDGTALLKFKLK